MKLIIPTIQDIAAEVTKFLPLLHETKIVLLYGEMGMGKTTFTQEVLRQMGISHLEGSPTYSLVNEYESEKYGKIYHLDLYRLKSDEEAYDIGIEEILDGKSYCFIEWPEKIESFLEDDFLEMKFSLNTKLEREITITKKS
ncbi:MAG: tRNA (adenosine(37)-N6)-threonylcarbamoyltransferase complex ATPase subunit type 1 TsaE [Flavobacteriia bacterium]|jgi:tRNA threonylcarbamoyladenosine biosynthesis protein TsaE